MPVFYALETFTVNLINPDNDPDRVLYVGFTPVSYTHLDVYKRQALITAFGKTSAEKGDPGGSASAKDLSLIHI
ncbi:hypothetical protein [Erwinia amylovora]